MQISWAVPCDSCEIHDDRTATIYGAGFDAFGVESLPATIEFAVAVGLVLEEGESSDLEIHVIGPLMRGVQSLSQPVVAEPGPSHAAGNFVSQIETVEIEYPIESVGGYVIELYGGAGQRTNFSFFFSVFEREF